MLQAKADTTASTDELTDLYQEVALNVLDIESKAIQSLKSRIDVRFTRAAKMMLNCHGRIVISGIGKSGHIGCKIAATLASTGTLSFFMHPSEALHGDLGMLSKDDILIMISNSGNNSELLSILHHCRRHDIPVIALCGNMDSELAQNATVTLDTKVEQEACPLGLAPTASTTAVLAMGDALAVSILKARGFTAQDFARSHPGGKLGKQLLSTVEDIMHSYSDIPKVTEGTLLKDAIIEVSAKRLGFTTIVKSNNKKSIVGVYTDGDLRRSLNKGYDINTTKIDTVMTTTFTTVKTADLAVDAAKMLTKKNITGLPVLNEMNQLVGAFNIHDLFRAGII